MNVWQPAFRKYINELKEKKPTLVAGDMNVCCNEIDIKNAESNKRRAGFTDEERNQFKDLLDDGWTDTFRNLHPSEVKFSFFTSRVPGTRERNVGWRLDYILACKRMMPAVLEAQILKEIEGSDHVPVVVKVDLNLIANK